MNKNVNVAPKSLNFKNRVFGLKECRINLSLLKFFNFYTLKKKSSWVLPLISLIIFSLLLLAVVLSDPETKAEVSFAGAFVSFFSLWGIVFSITKSADLMTSMEGQNLLLVSKPFYRGEIIFNKILYLVLLMLGHSIFLATQVFFLMLAMGTSTFKGYFVWFLLSSTLTFWLSSLLFSAITSLLATKLSIRWTSITSVIVFYLGSLLGAAYKPITIFLTAYYYKDDKEIIPKNNLDLSWKNNTLKTQTKVLLVQDQNNQKALSFSEEEINKIKEYYNSSRRATLIVRILQWLNIPYQVQSFNPINYMVSQEALFSIPFISFFNVGDIMSGNYITINETKNNISNELLLAKKHQGRAEYFLVPTLAASKNYPFAIINTQTSNNSQSQKTKPNFLENSLLVFKTKSSNAFFENKFKSDFLAIKNAQGEEKVRLQTELNKKISAYKERYGGVYSSVFSLNWSTIKNLLVSKEFSEFMKKFMDQTFFSLSEAQKNISIASSPSITKEWLNKKLIEKIVSKIKIAAPTTTLEWIAAAHYWIYLNYVDQRIAKVIASQDKDLTNFDPATNFVEIEEEEYGIGGIINTEYPKTDEVFKTSESYHILTSKDDSFTENFLFSFASNYIIYESLNGLVNLGIISGFWILCTLLLMLILYRILMRKDYK